MKNLFFLFVFCLAISLQPAFASQEREVEIYKNIRCLVCQGQSLNDSNSDFANDLKKIIKACGNLKIKYIIFPLVDKSSIKTKKEEKKIILKFKTLNNFLKKK